MREEALERNDLGLGRAWGADSVDDFDVGAAASLFSDATGFSEQVCEAGGGLKAKIARVVDLAEDGDVAGAAGDVNDIVTTEAHVGEGAARVKECFQLDGDHGVVAAVDHALFRNSGWPGTGGTAAGDGVLWENAAA